jgi:serine/threonine protein kinase
MKADIWSLGVVFYQMIYGKYPYYGETEYQIFEKSKNAPCFNGVNINEKAKDLILRCLKF